VAISVYEKCGSAPFTGKSNGLVPKIKMKKAKAII